MVHVLRRGGGVFRLAFCGWRLRRGGATRLGKPVASQGDVVRPTPALVRLRLDSPAGLSESCYDDRWLQRRDVRRKYPIDVKALRKKLVR